MNQTVYDTEHYAEALDSHQAMCASCRSHQDCQENARLVDLIASSLVTLDLLNSFVASRSRSGIRE